MRRKQSFENHGRSILNRSGSKRKRPENDVRLVCLSNGTKDDEEGEQKSKCRKMMSGSNQVPDNIGPWLGVWLLFWLQWSDMI